MPASAPMLSRRMALLPTSKASLRWFALLVGLIGLLTVGYAAAQDVYTVYVDHQPVMVRGRYATVAEVLAAAAIPWSSSDWIDPAPQTPADPETVIQLRRARTVTLRTEEGERSVPTHQATLGALVRELGLTLQRGDQIMADGILVNLRQLEQTPLPAVLQVGRFRSVTLVDNDQQRLLYTAAQTVGQVLAEANVILYASDGVEPAADAWITPGMVITLQRSQPLTIVADGRIIQTRSHHTNALDVVAEAGIGLVGYDFTRPGPETRLTADAVIEVVRVTEDFQLVDTSLPFQTMWQPSDQLEIDNVVRLQAGEPGIQRQRVRVRYENGVEVSRMVDGEWVAREPLPEIIGYGTRIVVGVVETPEGPREYWRKVRMRVTSYTAASAGRSPDDPLYGITASGRRLTKGIVAADRSVVPFGSTVYVPGYGNGYVGDVGGGVVGRWIDLGYDAHNYVSWSGYVDVYYLTPIPPPDQINYLLPGQLP